MDRTNDGGTYQEGRYAYHALAGLGQRQDSSQGTYSNLLVLRLL